MKKKVLKAYAKVNLFLEITGKRPDGFHNLESVFARISLHDTLTVEKSGPGLKIEIEDRANLGKIDEKDNLVYKAAEAFFSEFKINPAVKIKLRKNIPAGAGLGGGSSDCAETLRGLALLYSVRPSSRRLFKIAEKLGSDVPFFLSGKSFAFCSGRGEKVRGIDVRAELPGLLVVWPDSFISTKEVYGRFRLSSQPEILASRRRIRAFIALLGKKGRLEFSSCLFNRLEEAALPFSARALGAKKELLKAGLPCLMSGSGSSVFALSYSPRRLASLFRELSSLHKLIFLAKFK